MLLPAAPTLCAEFTDYVDCARVRIAGGVPQTATYTPVLLPRSDASPDGTCLAVRNRRGLCRGDVCEGGRPMNVSIMKVRGGYGRRGAPRTPRRATGVAVGGDGGGGVARSLLRLRGACGEAQPPLRGDGRPAGRWHTRPALLGGTPREVP